MFLIEKLRSFLDLSDRDQAILRDFCTQRVKHLEPGETVVQQGAAVQFWHAFCEGWGVREKVIEDGRTQIVGLLLPGDMCGLDPLHMHQADHTIRALDACTVGLVSPFELKQAIQCSDRIAAVFAIAGLEAQSVQREWTLNVGRRSAEEGLAHLISELHYRLSRAGVIRGDRFAVPMTQETIADCMALSPVHLSRSMSALRAAGLVSVAGGEIRILDPERLHQRAGFEPAYLEIAQ